MATYKAEFLSHYYEGRLRPRSAYASGLIFRWARMASRFPALANFATHAPVLNRIAKFMAGYAQQRRLPPFAAVTFKDWWRRRPVHNEGAPKVVLWADTFSNHFQPEVAKAAVEALEDAGFQVHVPLDDLCCGRPLYDYGMLDRARRELLKIIRVLRPEIEQGRPIVVLEPSCASVFRDEMTSLLWGNVDASRLRNQVFLLSEFLQKKIDDYRPPRLSRKVYAQGHCHHKSIMKMDDEAAVLKKMGVQYAEFDSGCCGMAGAFGYERGDHYDVSMACGERKLLPAVRSAERDAVIVADGFSCREQIEQTTDRRGLHLAQVLQMAIHERDGSPAPHDLPERDYPGQIHCPARRGHAVRNAAIAGTAIAAAVLIARGRRWK
jgi:Fe-S oxidoreductase